MGISLITRVLTSDFQWRKARDLGRGDELVSVDGSGRYWEVTRISRIYQVRSPGWRMNLTWGFSLEGTADQLIFVMSKQPSSDSPAEGVWTSIDDVVAKDLMPLTFLGEPWKKSRHGDNAAPADEALQAGKTYGYMCEMDDIKGERMVIEWVKERKEFDLEALPNRIHRGMTSGPSPMRLPRTERALMAYGRMRATPEEAAPHVTRSTKMSRAKALEIETTVGTLLAEGFVLRCAKG